MGIGMVCLYCRDETRTVADNIWHEECRAEWDRRVAAGICVKCGDSCSAPGGSWWCSDCRGIFLNGGVPQYVNYPGGGG